MLPTTKSFPPTKLPRIALMEEDFADSVARRLYGESRSDAARCTKKLPLHFIHKMSLHTDFQLVNCLIFFSASETEFAACNRGGKGASGVRFLLSDNYIF